MLIVLIPLPEFVVGVVICLRPATPVYNFWCALQHWTQFTWIWLLTASFFYKGNPGFCISWGNPDFFFEEILTYASSFSVELSRTCYVDVYSLHWFFESTWVWLAALLVLCFDYHTAIGLYLVMPTLVVGTCIGCHGKYSSTDRLWSLNYFQNSGKIHLQNLPFREAQALTCYIWARSFLVNLMCCPFLNYFCTRNLWEMILK